MSKVETLKEKYKKLGQATLDYFVDADKTPTKKYLEYMLKTWENRHKCSVSVSKLRIVNATIKFEELLPYIENKDIYNSAYNDLYRVLTAIENAEQVREEKTFVKENNVIVIKETETYLLLAPLTHRGSLKYGASTRWCTASKDNPATFKNYVKGNLVYLIDKTGKRSKYFEKVAMYSPNNFSIGDSYATYNAFDSSVRFNSLMLKGWTEDEIFEIDLNYRNFARQNKKIRESIDEVNTVLNFMDSFNVQSFKANLETVIGINMIDTTKLETTINNFNEKLNKFKNVKEVI